MLPLAKAVNKDDVAEVRRLLSKHGLDVNAKDANGSALHHAARGGHITAMQALLANPDLDVNLVHKASTGINKGDKMTPLKFALQEHQVDAVKLLLADPRTNLAATINPNPFRQKKPNERESLYQQAKAKAEYAEGVPLLVFAAKLGSVTSYKHQAPEVAEMLGLLLDDPRTTVNQTLGKTAMTACLENDACLAHLKAHSSRTFVDDAAITYARNQPQQSLGAFLVAAAGGL